jgi:hypothetical protein
MDLTIVVVLALALVVVIYVAYRKDGYTNEIFQDMPDAVVDGNVLFGPRCGYGFPECPAGYSRHCYVDPETGIGRCLLRSECGYQKPPCPSNQRCYITHNVDSGEGVGFCDSDMCNVIHRGEY